MKKKAALSYFITLSILIMISFVFSFVSLPLPTSNYTFKGFLRSIPKGIDFGGGSMAIYDIEKDHFEGTDAEAMSATLGKLSSLLNKKYSEPRISQVGKNQIKVVVPGGSFAPSINTNYIVGAIEISTEHLHNHDHDHDHGHDHDEHAPLNGSHIDHVKYVSANGVPTVWIEFTDEGKGILEDITKDFSSSSEGTIYLYTDKDYDNPLLQVKLTTPVGIYPAFRRFTNHTR